MDVGRYCLRRCSKCSLVYAETCAAPEDIYVDGYLTGVTQFGVDTTPPWMEAHLRSIAHQRAEIIEAATGPGQYLLDVGCGTGDFLNIMKQRGWEVQGVEPVEESAERARQHFGLDVRTGVLEKVDLPKGSYDVISLFHVVEHMQDATGFVRSAARWARPGGFVVIEVPNFFGFARRRHRDTWLHLRPGEHISHFTPGTLRRLFIRAGMQPCRILTPTWIGEPLSVPQVTELFGLPPLPRLTRYISRFQDYEGEWAPRPTSTGWRAWATLESAYRVARLGGLLMGIAQMPST